MKVIVKILFGMMLCVMTIQPSSAQQKNGAIDIDSPGMELLNDQEIIDALNDYFSKTMPNTSGFERATQVLYNVKSEKVRNVYVLNVLITSFEEFGYQPEVDGLLEDIEICSKTEATKQKAKELKENYYPISSREMAPDFEMEDEKGIKMKLSDYKNKFVFIYAWTLSSPECVGKMTDFIALKDKYKTRENVEFMSICIDSESMKSSWLQFLKNNRYRGKVHHTFAKASDLVEKYCITKCPRYILVDPVGKIVSAWFMSPEQEYFSFVFNIELNKSHQ